MTDNPITGSDSQMLAEAGIRLGEAHKKIERLSAENEALVKHVGREGVAEIERLTKEANQHLVAYQAMFNDNERLKVLLREAANEIDELGFPSVANKFLSALDQP